VNEWISRQSKDSEIWFGATQSTGTWVNEDGAALTPFFMKAGPSVVQNLGP